MELKQNFYNPYQVKHRRRTSKDQLALLEGTFKTTPKPSSDLRKQLATALHMSAREVQIWFQNRRAKQKNLMLRAGNNTASSASASAGSPSSKAVGSPDTPPVSSSSLISSMLPSANHPSKQQLFARAASVERATATSSSHRINPAPVSASVSLSSGFGLKDDIAQPPPALRRHSDIPTSYVGSSQPTAPVTACASSPCATAATRHNGPPIDEQHMSSAVATALGAVTSIATAPATAECASPQAMAFAAAMAAAAATSSLPPTSPHGIIQQHQHSTAYGMTSPPRSALQVPMQLSKKQKKAGNSGSADSYHMARVHHEAFDGTNVLPLKPDDLSPQSADDQFNLLDPANLPNFMMPGAPATAHSMLGAGGSNSGNSSSMLYGSGSSGFGHLAPAPFISQQQPNVNISAGLWDAPYASDHQQHGLLAAQPSAPQTDMSLLFSGLLGMNQNGYTPPSLSVSTTGAAPTTTGMLQPSSTHCGATSEASTLSPPNSALSIDATSFYNTLFSLTQQSQLGTMSHQYLQQQHGPVSAGIGYSNHEMSPVSSIAESIVMASSPAMHSSKSENQPPPLVHTSMGDKQQGDCGAAMFIPNTSFSRLIASGISETSALGGASALFSAPSGSPARVIMAGECASGGGSSSSSASVA
ncbi:hypothetical protein EV175_004857 [Coemansia sp. RSA 1933]|nr:hypothetical protein EV175_004857 [Coemansia sp. RSA 1933]